MQTVKTCAGCGVDKDIEKFGRYKIRGVVAYRNYCKQCRVLKERERYFSSKDIRDKTKKSARKSILKNKYGISEQEFELQVKKQNGLCAICLMKKELCIDHDHTSGIFRGLLCKQCNFALGNLYDNNEYFYSAARYLEKFNKNKYSEFCSWLNKTILPLESINTDTYRSIRDKLAAML